MGSFHYLKTAEDFQDIEANRLHMAFYSLELQLVSLTLVPRQALFWL